MQLLYWIEMPPSNRLGINDDEDDERSAFNIHPRSAAPSHGAPVHSRSLGAGPICAFRGKEEVTRTLQDCRFLTSTTDL
jgi:hypothetical protein